MSCRASQGSGYVLWRIYPHPRQGCSLSSGQHYCLENGLNIIYLPCPSVVRWHHGRQPRDDGNLLSRALRSEHPSGSIDCQAFLSSQDFPAWYRERRWTLCCFIRRNQNYHSIEENNSRLNRWLAADARTIEVPYTGLPRPSIKDHKSSHDLVAGCDATRQRPLSIVSIRYSHKDRSSEVRWAISGGGGLRGGVKGPDKHLIRTLYLAHSTITSRYKLIGQNIVGTRR